MISLKTPEEISAMREGGKILARVLEGVLAKAVPGTTTKELDAFCEKEILKAGAKVAFKGYHGFPSTLCVSVNEEVVHGVPSSRVIQGGDIVKLDLGLIWKGMYLDMARTVIAGTPKDAEAVRFVRSARKALKRGIKKVRPGITTGDVGNTIQRFLEDQGFGIVKELCGHGIGKNLHEDPQVPNYGKRREGAVLKENMVICIEPMITMGGWQVRLAKDGQTYVTIDGSLAAHAEDTILVTAEGFEVLTVIKGEGE